MTAKATLRAPSDWIEDMWWHRHMHRQSRFRWAPENPIAIALQWTKGRVEHTTPGHLARLDQQLLDLRVFAGGIDDAMVPLLRDARQRVVPGQWLVGLELIGLTDTDVAILDFHYHDEAMPQPENREATRALKGIPLPNPLSQVWELRQMRSMYAAAETILEDTVYDLALELAPRYGWDHLAAICPLRLSGRHFKMMAGYHSDERGRPDDPRRVAEQTVGPLPSSSLLPDVPDTVRRARTT